MPARTEQYGRSAQEGWPANTAQLPLIGRGGRSKIPIYRESEGIYFNNVIRLVNILSPAVSL